MCESSNKLFKRMKRLLQFVSILTILLLVGQPTLTRASCAWASAASLPGTAACPMGMTRMGEDCRIAGQMAASNCPANCCRSALQPSMARRAAPFRPRVSLIGSVAALLPAVAETRPASAVRPPGDSPFAGTERHIFLQVFRI
jgi:hypothetical protein